MGRKERVIAMKRKTKIILLIPGSIIVFAVLVIAVFGINIVVHRYQNNQMEEDPMPAQELSSFLISEGIQEHFFLQGKVEEINGANLIVRGFNIETGEPLYLVVPVGEDTKITSIYALPKGADKEEAVGSCSTLEGKEYKLGERDADIKVGDYIHIDFDINPDNVIKDIQVSVWSSLADSLY
ncbi:MAG: hypothetical protein E3J83_06250 [Candidatus Atribacteria bacterium]|nr:MAG: hypothetical protein E3J83_06250 [Candidatus Atribacteria bacterium]